MARMEHFAIFANDLNRLKDFYVDVLGLRVILNNSKAPTAGYFLADENGVSLEIIQRPESAEAVETRYLLHTAFLVDDYIAERHRLERLGVVFEGDTVVETDSVKTAFFLDPEGNRAQIVWRREPLGS